jgi:hypothetical protein
MNFSRFNKFLRPVGGKYFIDGDGVTFRAEQWEHLVNRVAGYRKRAGKPPGDPKAEIEAQVCARQSDYCQDNPAAPPVAATEAAAYRENAGQLTKRVTRWLANLLALRRAGGVRKVSIEASRRRAAICAVCSMQREFSGVCGACKATRKQAGALILGTEKRVNSQLKGCLVLGEDTSLSVSIEQPATGNPGLPGECWRR